MHIWVIECHCKTPRHCTDRNVVAPWVFWTKRAAVNALNEGICDGRVVKYEAKRRKRKEGR
jgi:hypothetical protein